LITVSGSHFLIHSNINANLIAIGRKEQLDFFLLKEKRFDWDFLRAPSFNRQILDDLS